MTYAIIELGGKQYRVEKGDSLLVDRLDAKEGAKVAPRPLLFSGGNKTVIEGPELDKVKIEAVVAEHVKGEKVRVFKYRPKKRYRRRAGHRSLLTRLEINELRGPTTARATVGSGAGQKTAARAAARKPAKKEGEAGAQAKKPAARRSPARSKKAKDD